MSVTSFVLLIVPALNCTFPPSVLVVDVEVELSERLEKGELLGYKFKFTLCTSKCQNLPILGNAPVCYLNGLLDVGSQALKFARARLITEHQFNLSSLVSALSR